MKAEYRIKSDSDVPHRPVIPRVVTRWSPFPVLTKEKVHKCWQVGCRSDTKSQIMSVTEKFSNRRLWNLSSQRDLVDEICVCLNDLCLVLSGGSREGLDHWFSNFLFVIPAFSLFQIIPL